MENVFHVNFAKLHETLKKTRACIAGGLPHSVFMERSESFDGDMDIWNPLDLDIQVCHKPNAPMVLHILTRPFVARFISLINISLNRLAIRVSPSSLIRLRITTRPTVSSIVLAMFIPSRSARLK
jgi:hypothetical protein